MGSESSQTASRPLFVTTRWTQVLAARGESPEARAALADLCQAYWLPVFRFIRRGNYEEDAARDLAQEFFAQLLGQQRRMHVEQGRGRFRSYLLGAVKHFLSDQQDRANAAKRGAGLAPAPLDEPSGNSTATSLQIADPAAPLPDAWFDRQWALTLIERALNSLAREYSEAGKGLQFETLKPWLVGEVESASQVDAARELSLSDGAVRVAIHRLRKRFRDLVKGEIIDTVDRIENVQAELNYLLEALAQS